MWCHLLWYMVTKSGTVIPVYQTVRHHVPVNHNFNVNLFKDLHVIYLDIRVFGHCTLCVWQQFLQIPLCKEWCACVKELKIFLKTCFCIGFMSCGVRISQRCLDKWDILTNIPVVLFQLFWLLLIKMYQIGFLSWNCTGNVNTNRYFWSLSLPTTIKCAWG
jgi:hypothetical protein